MEKNEIIAKFATHEGDTGSPEVQIALLTARINHLNEHLKAQDQLAWVGAMNSIRNRAEEIVLKELIYGEDAV